MSPALQRVLDTHPYPALVSTPRWDTVAWNAAAVERPQGVKVIAHPQAGQLELEHVTLAYSEPNARALRVTRYTPRPGESSERARVLFGITLPT